MRQGSASSPSTLGTRVLPDRLGDFTSTSVDTYRLSVPITYWNGLRSLCDRTPAGARVRDSGEGCRLERSLRRTSGARMLHVLHLQPWSVAFAGDWVCGRSGARPTTLAARLRHDRGRRPHGSCDPRRLAQGRPDQTGRLVRPGDARRAPLRACAARPGRDLGCNGGRVDARRPPHRCPAKVRVAWAGALVAALVIAAGATFVSYGSPVHVAQRAWHTVSTEVEPNRGTNNGRLFDLGSSSRIALGARPSTRSAPIPSQGTGGETFWQVWAANPRRERQCDRTTQHLPRDTRGARRDRPGTVAGRARAAAGGCAAGRATRRSCRLCWPPMSRWMVHSGLDWDWTLVGVTGPGLLCGVALLAGSRGEATARRPSVGRRCSRGTGVGLLAFDAASSQTTGCRRPMPRSPPVATTRLSQRRAARGASHPGRSRRWDSSRRHDSIRDVGPKRSRPTGRPSLATPTAGLRGHSSRQPRRERTPPRRSRRAATQSARRRACKECLARAVVVSEKSE